MANTGIVRDERYLEHDTGGFHVENPERLVHIYRALDDLHGPFVDIPPRPATIPEVIAVHDPEYVDRIAATAGRSVRLDPDTVASPRTYEIALLAAGGLLEAVDAVMSSVNAVKNAIALVRPPGHHAERNRAMGFCIFNNVAIAAKHVLATHGIDRVLIIDWDLHHGNGTQNTFYTDPNVLYFSTHQYPFYPGTGHYTEMGEGNGKGYTVNVPLSYGHSETDYANIFRHLLRPITLQYRPQLILISAGFDIYYRDPLGGMNVSEDGFARLADIVMDLAADVCEGKIVITLEGGYNLEGIASSVREVVKTLAALAPVDSVSWEKREDKEYPQIRPIVETVKNTLKDYWRWEDG